MKNGRNTAGKFTSGNTGRPKGARNKKTLAIQSLLEGQATALTVNDLLIDLREVLRTFIGPEIGSSALLELLQGLPEGDWHVANNGRTITSKWLAKQLRPYSITPYRRRTGNVYMLADFEDAFNRYLPPI